MAYKLSDRPGWWLPLIMKRMTILASLLAIVMWLCSLIIYWFYDTITLHEGEDEASSVYLNLGGFAEGFAYGALAIIFYAGVFWMLSLAVDKIDQLVWLNASDEDREEILAKRKKKNAKNQ